MKPYYENSGIKIYHGDAREILPGLKKVDTIITDPVWPNSSPMLEGYEDPYKLFEETAVNFPFKCDRVVIQMGCVSDPRFLMAIPPEMKFLRACWLRFTMPVHRGRILVGSDVAYVYGAPPRPKKGHILIPGECDPKKASDTYRIANRCHPCARQYEHVEWLIRKFVEKEVIDPFMGSGTTLVAAKKLGLRAIGIDTVEEYCEITAKRIEDPENSKATTRSIYNAYLSQQTKVLCLPGL